MFAVIYRFTLKPHQETLYKTYWNELADYFINNCGAIGSCLHKGENGLWVAYSRWPDKETRDVAWPGDNTASHKLPQNIQHIISKMQDIKKENHDTEQYDEICLELVEDKLGIVLSIPAS